MNHTKLPDFTRPQTPLYIEAQELYIKVFSTLSGFPEFLLDNNSDLNQVLDTLKTFQSTL